jgi:hypothetical protein
MFSGTLRAISISFIIKNGSKEGITTLIQRFKPSFADKIVSEGYRTIAASKVNKIIIMDTFLHLFIINKIKQKEKIIKKI